MFKYLIHFNNFLFAVCKATVEEMLSEIKKVDPKKRADVGGYRMDSKGNSVTKTVQYSKSETYLTELTETICKFAEKMSFEFLSFYSIQNYFCS